MPFMTKTRAQAPGFSPNCPGCELRRCPAVLVVVAGLLVWGAVGLPKAVEHDHLIRTPAAN